jgi:hypothetical protein
MLAVTAYEAGRVAGRMAILGLIAAIVAYAFRGWFRATFPRNVRIVLAVTAAGAVFAYGMNRTDETDLKRARAEMLAGCQDTSSPEARPLCGCMVDEVLKLNGTQPGDLARLDDEVRAVEYEGAPMPAVFRQAADHCAATLVSRPSA